MEERFTKIEDKLDNLTGTVDALSGKFDALGKNVESLSSTVESLSSTVESLSKTMETGFKDVHEKIDTLAIITAKGFEKNEEDHRRMWQFMAEESRWTRAEIHDIKTILLPIAQLSGEHEARLDNHHIRIGRLEKKIP